MRRIQPERRQPIKVTQQCDNTPYRNGGFGITDYGKVIGEWVPIADAAPTKADDSIWGNGHAVHDQVMDHVQLLGAPSKAACRNRTVQ